MANVVEMQRRESTDGETARLREAVRELAWQHARTKSGLKAGDPPRNPFDADALDGVGQRAAVLAQLAALGEVRDLAQQLIAITATIAGETGASGEAIGEALGVTRAAVRKKFPNAVAGTRGPRPAVFTTAGIQEWTGFPEDQPAEQDWIVRARVRLRRQVRTGGAGPARVGHAGQEVEMVMRGRAGADVAPDYWSTDEPALQALVVHISDAQVLDVLEEISPWSSRTVELITDSMRAEDTV